MLKILPYKIGSKSAKALARALGVLRIRTPSYRQRRRDIILNWGCSQPAQGVCFALNQPQAVAKASNKLVALRTMRAAGVAVPDFTSSRGEAIRWLIGGAKVVCRTLLCSHSGNGVVVAETEGGVVDAPLYTKYFRRDAEYRVHVFQGEVIDYVHKKRRNGYADDPNFNPYVRTHRCGWVFARDGVALPELVAREARNAVASLGLDFGAVDVLSRGIDRVVVLEVNTAPGLEGTSLVRYVAAIKNFLDSYVR